MPTRETSGYVANSAKKMKTKKKWKKSPLGKALMHGRAAGGGETTRSLGGSLSFEGGSIRSRPKREQDYAVQPKAESKDLGTWVRGRDGRMRRMKRKIPGTKETLKLLRGR